MSQPGYPTFMSADLFSAAIQFMGQRDKVWFATGSEILDAYLKARA